MKQLKKASRLIIRRKPFSFLLNVIVLATQLCGALNSVYSCQIFIGAKSEKIPTTAYNGGSTVYHRGRWTEINEYLY